MLVDAHRRAAGRPGCPTTPPSWSPPTTGCSTSPARPGSTSTPSPRWPTASGCSQGSPAPGTCTLCPARRPTSWRVAGGPRRAGLGGSREEAVASGVFGPVDDALAARIGDVVALARGSWASPPEREPGPSRLVAYHGSLTATELAIPLLAARGRVARLSPAGDVPGARVRRMGRPAGEPVGHRGRAALHRRHDRRRRGRPSSPPSARVGAGRSSAGSRSPAGRPGRAAPAPRGRGAGRPAPAPERRPDRAARAAPPARARAPHEVPTVAGHLPVVEAVRQDDDVGREPVTAQMTALPDVRGARRRHRTGQRAARNAQQASWLPWAQIRKTGRSARGPTEPSQGAVRRSSAAARTDHQRPSARGGCRRGPAATGVGQPLLGAPDQQQPHVLRP